MQFSGTAVRSLTRQQVERCLALNGKLSELDEDRISATNGITYIGLSFAPFSFLRAIFMEATQI